jgi:hypothetical protein
MKLYLLPLLILTGCDAMTWKSMPTQTASYTRVVDKGGNLNYELHSLTIDGHTYWIVQRSGIAIIHSESCACKNK